MSTTPRQTSTGRSTRSRRSSEGLTAASVGAMLAATMAFAAFRAPLGDGRRGKIPADVAVGVITATFGATFAASRRRAEIWPRFVHESAPRRGRGRDRGAKAVANPVL